MLFSIRVRVPSQGGCSTPYQRARNNPFHIGVLSADQPPHIPVTIAKLVGMTDGLHVEDKMHVMTGKLFCGSGWLTILSFQDADIWLCSVNIQCTSNACGMSIKLLSCFLHANARGLPRIFWECYEPQMAFDMWELHSKTWPQFEFWKTIMDIGLLMTPFSRFLLDGDFKFYVQTCNELCGWCDAVDHINYVHWHVPDMVQLTENAQKFMINLFYEMQKLHCAKNGLCKDPGVLSLFSRTGRVW